MASNKSVSRKGLIVFLAVLIIIGLGVGLFFILKPKADLNAPYNDTYELFHSEDFSYVKSRNTKVEDVLKNELSGTTNETYNQTKAEVVVFNQVSEILGLQEDLYLKNLKFTEEKDDGMAKLQQDIRKTYEQLNKNIAECKKYLETYLTNNQIQQYENNDSLYQKVYNYKFLYEKLIDSETKYFEYMSRIFAEYLSDTITVNKYTKINARATASWARKITEYYVKYDTEEISQHNFTASLNCLINFTDRHYNDDDLYYIDNKADCDVLAENVNNLDFAQLINALATYSYGEYVESLEGATKDSAVALQSYFL